jgi:Bacterial sugar transferase
VQLPADTSLETVRRKLAYDLYYIHHLGPWLDLRILLCTALYAVGVPFRVSRELFRVPGGEAVARTVPPPPAEQRAPRARKAA